ncbi:MAG: hypothetical protein SGARI_002887, partial [Bacillariaceae sp.]
MRRSLFFASNEQWPLHICQRNQSMETHVSSIFQSFGCVYFPSLVLGTTFLWRQSRRHSTSCGSSTFAMDSFPKKSHVRWVNV